jgi:hypothetical protein
MFAKVLDGYVNAYSAFGHYTGYDYCMTHDYVNFYIDNLFNVFYTVRPTSDCFPIGGKWPNGAYFFEDRVGMIPGQLPVAGPVDMDDYYYDDIIYHMYYFTYTKVKFKTAPEYY